MHRHDWIKFCKHHKWGYKRKICGRFGDYESNSQDGTIDMPYEEVIIQRFKSRIYFLNKNLTGVESLSDDMQIAEYSTEAKALKAMEMLREAFFENKHEETYREGIYYYSPCFQFPQDDEIEA